jgi:3-oxoacyl-[acyl-carrier protein] reductase
MEINLLGKTAFVTGGSIGIGRAASLSLAHCGADVAFSYFSHQEEGEATAEAI